MACAQRRLKPIFFHSVPRAATRALRVVALQPHHGPLQGTSPREVETDFEEGKQNRVTAKDC
eukprot:6462785-Amphidinium_carterae.1